MACYHKCAILNKVSRKLIGESTKDPLKVRSLRKSISEAIKLQTVRKDVLGSPQFRLNLSDLERSLDGKIHFPSDVSSDEFSSQIADGVAYFKVDPCKFAQDIVSCIRTQKSKYGYLDHDGFMHQVCIEFSSPNIAKPFHVGHLRSTIIGHVLANIYEAGGHAVKRVNFLGDWGTQFGLLSLGLQRSSSEEQWKEDPLLEFFKVYVDINKQVKTERSEGSETTSPTYEEALALFAQLEKGDPELRALWSTVRSLSVQELNNMYQRLGVNFTHTMSESSFQKTEEVLKCLRNSNLLQYDENGVGYVETDTPQGTGRASVVKSDGASLYMTRDIAAALERRKKFSIDRMHYVVENGQRAHFTNLTSILHQMGFSWATRPIDEIHVRFGRVLGMSTRSGNVVFLKELLDEAKARIAESMMAKETTQVTTGMDQVAEALAVTAIILQDLKADRTKDYTFSWERALSFKADSGLFVQYCHARVCSLLTNSGMNVKDDIDPECLRDDATLHMLILHMARYPDVFNHSLSTLAPHHIVQYLFRLCHLVNSAYAACPIKGQNKDIAQARLLVFECARQVLHNCLRVLGARPVTKM